MGPPEITLKVVVGINVVTAASPTELCSPDTLVELQFLGQTERTSRKLMFGLAENGAPTALVDTKFEFLASFDIDHWDAAGVGRYLNSKSV